MSRDEFADAVATARAEVACFGESALPADRALVAMVGAAAKAKGYAEVVADHLRILAERDEDDYWTNGVWGCARSVVDALTFVEAEGFASEGGSHIPPSSP